MTNPLATGNKALRIASVVTATFAFLLPSIARAQSRAGLDVSVGAVAASNPYLLNGKNLAEAGANLTLDPSVYLEDDRTSLDVVGNLRLDKYFGKYDLGDSFAVRATGNSRISEKTALTTDVEFRSSKSPANRFYSGISANLAPGEISTDSQFDPTLANLTGRISRLEVNASLKRLLDAKSSLTASGGLGLTRVSSSEGTDYRDTHIAVDYSRNLTEATTTLFTVEGGYTDYLHQHGADGLYVTSLIGLKYQITRSLNLSGQIGGSVATIKSPTGSRTTTATWAGELDLCNKNAKETACITGRRLTQPTSLAGLTIVSSVGISYAHDIGSRGTISATATYARTNRSALALFPASAGRSELVSASGTFRRRIGNRVSAFVTPSFTSVKDEQRGKRHNYELLLGVSYSFGRRQ